MCVCVRVCAFVRESVCVYIYVCLCVCMCARVHHMCFCVFASVYVSTCCTKQICGNAHKHVCICTFLYVRAQHVYLRAYIRHNAICTYVNVRIYISKMCGNAHKYVCMHICVCACSTCIYTCVYT